MILHKDSLKIEDEKVDIVFLTKQSKNYISQLKYYYNIVGIDTEVEILETILDSCPIIVIMTEDRFFLYHIHPSNKYISILHGDEVTKDLLKKYYYLRDEIRDIMERKLNYDIIMNNGVVVIDNRSNPFISDYFREYNYFYGMERFVKALKNNENVKGISTYVTIQDLICYGWDTFHNIEYIKERSDNIITRELFDNKETLFPDIKMYFGRTFRHHPNGIKELPPMELMENIDIQYVLDVLHNQQEKYGNEFKIPYNGFININYYGMVVGHSSLKKYVDYKGCNCVLSYSFSALEDFWSTHLFSLFNNDIDNVGIIFLTKTHETKNKFKGKVGYYELSDII